MKDKRSRRAMHFGWRWAFKRKSSFLVSVHFTFFAISVYFTLLCQLSSISIFHFFWFACVYFFPPLLSSRAFYAFARLAWLILTHSWSFRVLMTAFLFLLLSLQVSYKYSVTYRGLPCLTYWYFVNIVIYGKKLIISDKQSTYFNPVSAISAGGSAFLFPTLTTPRIVIQKAHQVCSQHRPLKRL